MDSPSSPAVNVRIIKKYPNRRLYDTATSSYITVAEVKALVLEQTEFCVVDARSNADLTRCTLLQIILEEENGGIPLFSCEALAQIIRCYGQTMQSEMCNSIEHYLKDFLDTHCPECVPDGSANSQAQPNGIASPATRKA